MDHLFDSFFVIFAQINNSGVGLTKLAATCAIEETASRTNNGSVNGPLPVVACDCKVAILSAEVKSAMHQNAPHFCNSDERCAGGTYADKAFNRSVCGFSLSIGDGGPTGSAMSQPGALGRRAGNGMGSRNGRR